MKFQWRYSLQNNVPWLIMALVITIAYPFDYDWHIIFPLCVILIGILWSAYYLIFQRSYLKQHPQDKERNRHLNGWGFVITILITVAGISLLIFFGSKFDSSDNFVILALWLVYVIRIVRDFFAFPKTAK